MFGTLVAATAQDHQKHALIYYILKDCKANDLGNVFAREVHLPRKYNLLISGFHALDTDRPKSALEYLTDPSLPPIFSDEILSSLLKSEKLERSLLIAYYVTVTPPLADDKLLHAFFSYLCETDIEFAYNFASKQVASHRRALFEQLIQVSLSSHGSGDRPAEQLVGLPFSQEEVLWFEDFLIKGSGSTLHGARDSVIMRRIATGNDFVDIQDLQPLRGPKKGVEGWEELRPSLGLAS